MLVSDMLNASARVLGVLGKGETLDTYETADGLQALNMMLDAWSAERLMLAGMTLENFPLVAGTASYTIGSGQTFNTTKPLKINDAYIRDSNKNDYPLDIISEEMYDSLPDKDYAISLPEYLFYDRGETEQATQTGTIYLYSIPDKPYTLFIDSQKILSEFASAAVSFTLEAPYEEAIKFNLAIRQFYEYYPLKMPIPKDLKDLAEDSKANIKRLNHQLQVATLDLPGRKGMYNIETDSYTH